MRTIRKIIRIDEDRCDGCGLCIPACEEGALEIVDGKARLVSEVYCDGLGNCLGECPRGAITIEEREAAEFDHDAMERHLRRAAEGAGCSGALAQALKKPAGADRGTPEEVADAAPSELSNWPVQLRLAPVTAAYFAGVNLVICADCVPFAFRNFHQRFLAGRTVLVGCPKLDDTDLYHRKLTQIFSENDIESVEVVRMEVPCCSGLVHLVDRALKDSGEAIPATVTTIGIEGDVIESTPLARAVEVQ